MVHTSANNKVLIKVKKVFNSKIYKVALYKLNNESEQLMFEYLQQFVNRPIKVVLGVDDLTGLTTDNNKLTGKVARAFDQALFENATKV